MNSMSKSELVLALRGYGEEPPSAWNKIDLRARLEELAEAGEIEVKTSKTSKTPLQAAVSQLNRASRKKADLINHVEKELGMTVAPNATIADIQKLAMKVLMNQILGADQDVMGFGKHSEMTYIEVMNREPSYCRWAKDTYQEESTSIYLKRFVEWLLVKEKGGSKPSPMMVSPKKKSNQPKATATIQPKTSVTESSATASSAASSEDVARLTAMVATLAGELREMKEDKAASQPRKVMATQDVSMNVKSQDFR